MLLSEATLTNKDWFDKFIHLIKTNQFCSSTEIEPGHYRIGVLRDRTGFSVELDAKHVAQYIGKYFWTRKFSGVACYDVICADSPSTVFVVRRTPENSEDYNEPKMYTSDEYSPEELYKELVIKPAYNSNQRLAQRKDATYELAIKMYSFERSTRGSETYDGPDGTTLKGYWSAYNTKRKFVAMTNDAIKQAIFKILSTDFEDDNGMMGANLYSTDDMYLLKNGKVIAKVIPIASEKTNLGRTISCISSYDLQDVKIEYINK